jgi:hypothetical protein
MLKPGIYLHWQGAFHHVREVLADSLGHAHVIHRPTQTPAWQISSQEAFEAPVQNGTGEMVPSFTFVGNQENMHEALEDIFKGILNQARARRAQTDGYVDLFQRYSDEGIGAAIAEAERKMRDMVATLMDVIEKKTGTSVPSPAYEMLLGLPLLSRVVRADIEKHEGQSCCADKTRLLLRTYFYELLGFSPDLAVPD